MLEEDCVFEELLLSFPPTFEFGIALLLGRGRLTEVAGALLARYCASKRWRYVGYGAAERNSEAGAFAGGGGCRSGGIGGTGVDEDDEDEDRNGTRTAMSASA